MLSSNIESNKERFITLCNQWIKRDGLQELLAWLETTDFYEAPASSKYHLCCEGGLCEHSLNVYDRLLSEYANEGLDIMAKMESLVIVSLFHDVCKANFYQISERNVKNEYGVWIKIPYYSIENQGVLVGHGYKSARIVSKYIDITDEEYMAIAHHMGFSSDENTFTISEIFNKSKLTLLLHIADTKATYIDENIE